jgi:multidrug efflux pump
VKRFLATAIAHNRVVILALLTLLLAGTFAYLDMPREADPDVEIPYIYVRITHEGIAPEDAERLLIRPLEQELRAIEGIKEITASGYQGGAAVTIEFDAGVHTDVALQDVRAKVDAAKAKFPADTEEPAVQEVKISRFDPMLVLNLHGPVPERTLVAVARDLKDKIELLPGVLEVNTAGEREELVEIIVDPRAMESYGLSQQDIFNLVGRNNRLVAAGRLESDQGSFPVKVPGVFETPEDVLRLPIKVDGDRVVQFGDVAEARRTFKDPDSFARIDGQPAIGLEVVQRSGANVIDTVARVRQVVDAEQARWPAQIAATISRDKSVQIRDQVRELENNVLSAVLLVVIVIIGILGVRSALLVGVAIPGSFLTGLLVMSAFGLTLNMITLFSLIMAVGMLVDGAVIVTELADRKLAEGHPRAEAYAIAASRMSMPVISSTATTLAAFAPILFWPGIIGEFMRFLPITLITTLAGSLLMALVFVPALGGMFGRLGATSAEAIAQLAIAENGDLADLRGLTGRYVAFLRRALERPALVVLAVTLALVGIFLAYGRYGEGMAFFPDVDPDVANVEVRARGDLSILEKDALVRQVEQRVLGMPEVRFVYAKTGAGGRGAAPDLIGTIQLNFVDWRHRRPVADILAEVRQRTSGIAGIIVDVVKPAVGPRQGKPIRIELASRDPALLVDATDKVRSELAKIPGVINIEDDRPLPGIEWKLDVDRANAARFGADVTLVGNAVQLVTNGIKIGEYRPDDADDEIDIRVRYPYADRSLDGLDALRVQSAQGLVPIATFVKRTPVQRVGTISRTDLRRTMTIRADVAPGVLDSEVVKTLAGRLPGAGLDPRVSVEFKGGNRDQRESQGFLSKAFLIALAMIGVILVAQFNSIFQTLLILTAVVFSTGGVLLGHLITQQPFGLVMSGIGLIALAGIVVNNNIVLIDTYNLLRRTGMPATEAVLRTCAQRLRPVMLTTVTTILGLLPMVFGVNINLVDRDFSVGGPSAQWWMQLASSVAGGLAFATVLTLLFTPSLLMLQARTEAWWRARRARRDDFAETPAPERG